MPYSPFIMVEMVSAVPAPLKMQRTMWQTAMAMALLVTPLALMTTAPEVRTFSSKISQLPSKTILSPSGLWSL